MASALGTLDKLDDRVAVAYIEHTTFDPGRRRTGGDVPRGPRHAAVIPAREENEVLRLHGGGEAFRERTAEPLVGTCNESDS